MEEMTKHLSQPQSAPTRHIFAHIPSIFFYISETEAAIFIPSSKAFSFTFIIQNIYILSIQREKESFIKGLEVFFSLIFGLGFSIHSWVLPLAECGPKIGKNGSFNSGLR